MGLVTVILVSPELESQEGAPVWISVGSEKIRQYWAGKSIDQWPLDITEHCNYRWALRRTYPAARPRYTDLIGVGDLVLRSCQSSPDYSDTQQIWEQICICITYSLQICFLIIHSLYVCWEQVQIKKEPNQYLLSSRLLRLLDIYSYLIMQSPVYQMEQKWFPFG